MTLTADTPLWVAARYLVRARHKTFTTCFEGVLRSRDPEAFHDLRVASRRLRETIAVVSPCFPAPSLATARKMVRRVTVILGGIRNIDEARAFFSVIVDVPPPIAPSVASWLESLAETRGDRSRSVLSTLASFDSKGLKRRISSALDHPALFTEGVDPTVPVAPYLAAILGEKGDIVGDAARSLDSDTDSREEGMHRLRIAIKKFRYVFELAEQFAPEGYRDLLALLKAYQDTLGELNDTAVFQRMVTDSGLPSDAVAWLTSALDTRRENLLEHFATLRKGSPLETIGGDAVALIRA